MKNVSQYEEAAEYRSEAPDIFFTTMYTSRVRKGIPKCN